MQAEAAEIGDGISRRDAEAAEIGDDFLQCTRGRRNRRRAFAVRAEAAEIGDEISRCSRGRRNRRRVFAVQAEAAEIGDGDFAVQAEAAEIGDGFRGPQLGSERCRAVPAPFCRLRASWPRQRSAQHQRIEWRSAQIIYKVDRSRRVLNMISGMLRLASFADQKLASGQAYFTREEARDQLGISVEAAAAAAARLVKKGQLASPRNGFYLIVRPEDRRPAPRSRRSGSDLLDALPGTRLPSPLLRAAARHGSSTRPPRSSRSWRPASCETWSWGAIGCSSCSRYPGSSNR